ncbi:hypothetical protein GS937_05715 [Rhodococcus hoagii]|nr:hypothetical protein [Prescottella equi]NKR22132.1 hypothetical protein [Prescottella equi]NKW63922.1 hypothetical protein [Prescottella equi]
MRRTGDATRGSIDEHGPWQWPDGYANALVTTGRVDEADKLPAPTNVSPPNEGTARARRLAGHRRGCQVPPDRRPVPGLVAGVRGVTGRERRRDGGVDVGHGSCPWRVRTMRSGRSGDRAPLHPAADVRFAYTAFALRARFACSCRAPTHTLSTVGGLP